MDEETIASHLRSVFYLPSSRAAVSASQPWSGHRALAQRGALRVYSTPGKGSTFKLLFPATEAQPRRKTEHRPPALEESLTVLVIDDEEVVRRTAKAALERRGWKVIIAKTAPKA